MDHHTPTPPPLLPVPPDSGASKPPSIPEIAVSERPPPPPSTAERLARAERPSQIGKLRLRKAVSDPGVERIRTSLSAPGAMRPRDLERPRPKDARRARTTTPGQGLGAVRKPSAMPPKVPKVPEHRPTTSPTAPGLQRVPTPQSVAILKSPTPRPFSVPGAKSPTPRPFSVPGQLRSPTPRPPSAPGYQRARTPAPHRTPTGSFATAAHPDLGKVFGSYRVIEVLGEGGMGLVYLAEHVRLGRKVAMKRLKDRLAAKPESVEQFFAEARAVNRINHPHIVDITDFITGDGAAYYLMEYLEGETLADVVKREAPLPPSRVLYLVRQVAAALDAAHGAGFAHLDIKPSNIFLITKDGRSDHVKLLDFGTAQLLERAPKIDSPSKSGMFNLGTPVYMSPEQACGDTVDHRSDIYSLGAVIYEMLTGKPPFEAQSAPEYIHKHMSVPPKRITQLKGLPYKITRGAARAVMQCLEKNADDRPQSCAALVESLERSVTLTGYEGTPHQGVAAIAAAQGRSWTPVWVAAAVVALAVAGWALFARDGRSAEALGLTGAAEAGTSLTSAVERYRASLPKFVVLEVRTSPPMAEVSLVGPGGRVLGLTPLTYRTNSTTDTWKLRVRLAGHTDRIVEVVPDRNRNFTLELAKKAPPAAVADAPEPGKTKTEKRHSDRGREKPRARRRRPRERPKKTGMRKYDSVRTVDPFD
ncbi:MAG: protein kinase [bacterium]